MRKRTGSQPKGLGRNERGDRRSNSQPKFTRPDRDEYTAPTGAFGSFRAPEEVGVSDAVRLSTRRLAQGARRAERRWNGAPQTKSAIHGRIARMEARRASKEV